MCVIFVSHQFFLLQLTIDFESKFPPKEGTEYTIPKQGTTNQSKVFDIINSWQL